MQAVDDKAPDHGMVAIERVAATCVVCIASVRVEHVIGLIVDTPEGNGGASLIPLSSVVEDHIEDHRDPGGMQSLDQALEFRDLRAVMAG